MHSAVLADMTAFGSFTPDPLPDIRESDGQWVHSSIPLAVHIDSDGLEIVRLRQLVSPDGQLSEERNIIRLDPLTAAQLEAEAEGARLDGPRPDPGPRNGGSRRLDRRQPAEAGVRAMEHPLPPRCVCWRSTRSR